MDIQKMEGIEMTHIARMWRVSNFDEHPLMDRITCKQCGWRVEINEPHVVTNYGYEREKKYDFYHKWCWKKHA